MISPQKGILFDLDETLLDRTASLKRFVRHQFEELVLPDQCGKLLERFLELDANGSVWKDIVYRCLIDEFLLSSVSVEDLLEDYLASFKDFCIPRAGAGVAITAFAERGIPLGLVSNGPSPFQEDNFSAIMDSIRESSGFEGRFSAVIVSDAVGLRKPDTRIFKLACKQLQADPEWTVFVGDNPVADIQGAKTVGMKTVYIPGYFGDDCPQADAVCAGLSELPDIADTLWDA